MVAVGGGRFIGDYRVSPNFKFLLVEVESEKFIEIDSYRLITFILQYFLFSHFLIFLFFR